VCGGLFGCLFVICVKFPFEIVKCEFSESDDENELRKPPRISKTLPVGQIGTIEPIEG
jgi:hypothetical protein